MRKRRKAVFFRLAPQPKSGSFSIGFPKKHPRKHPQMKPIQQIISQEDTTMKGLKLRRVTAFILAFLMLSSLAVFELPVYAAGETEWEYFLEVQISDDTNSKTGNGHIFCNLFFNMNEKEQFGVPNTKKTGKFTSTTFTTTRAPWTLDKVQLENTHKDAFKFLWLRLGVRLKGSDSAYVYVLGSSSKGWYPSGTGKKDGYWIENEKGTNCPSTYTVYVSPEHKLKDAGNFVSEMTGELYLDVDSAAESDAYTEHKYDGRLSDQYDALLGSSYSCFGYSAPPTVTISATGVKGNAKDAVNFKALTQSGAAKELTDGSGRLLGYSLNPRKLSEYMNKHDVNRITVTAKLEFDSGTVYRYAPFLDGKTYKACDYTITRKAFGAGTARVRSTSASPYYSSRDNYYYNASDSSVPVEIYIKTDGNYGHISSDSLNGARFHYDNAILDLGNTGKTIELGAKDITLDGSKVSLNFPLQKGMTSAGDNLRVRIEGATLVPKDSSVTYRLWDSAAEKMQYASFLSGIKVDTVEPSVTVTATDGKALSGVWRDTLEIKAVSSKLTKTIYSDGTYELFLVNPADGRNEFFLSNGTCTGTSLFLPSGENFETTRKLWLNRTAEGSYTMKLTGTDIAGNKLETYIEDVRLDNKPPVVSVTEVRGTKRAADKSLANTYKVSVSDASGTGKFYYCFTPNGVLDEPAFNPDAALEQESGELETTFGKWAFIDQETAEKGAAALLKIGAGESYAGRMYYFGIDAFGHKTDVNYLSIQMDNEDTDCKVVYPESTSIPRPSYTISFETNAENTVSWKWIGRGLRSEYRTWIPGDPIGAAEQPDADGNTVLLNGEYYLNYRVTTPSGTTRESHETFVFDNAAPEIGATLVSGGLFDETATIKISASDAAGIASAKAYVVTPDGETAVGGEYSLDFAGSSASQTVTFTGLPSGRYSLAVAATDIYGNEALLDTENAPEFFIRSAKPAVTGEITGTPAAYNGVPLTGERKYTLNLNVTEDFANGDEGVYQYFYIRTSDDMEAFSEWQNLGRVDYQADKSVYSGAFTLDTPVSALVEGENKLYVQSVISAYGKVPDDSYNSRIVTSEFTIFYDESAPTYRLVFRDEHTADTLTAKLYAYDNLEAGVSVSCEDKSVLPSDETDESGAINVTFTQSGTFELVLSDAAGNTVTVPVTVGGIDKEGPTVSSTAQSVAVGERTDVLLYVSVCGATDENTSFAVVPRSEAKTVFGEETLSLDPTIAKSEIFSADASAFDGETDTTYQIKVAGATGDYVLAVRTADTVGNVTEYVSDAFTVRDAEAFAESFDASPKTTGARAKVKVKFNVPVKVLPLDSVTENEEDNYDAAKLLATSFSDTFSFIITQNGTYTLYMVDELGRGTKSDITVEDVTFGKLDNIKVYRYADDDTFSTDSPVADDAYIAANGNSKVAYVPGTGERIVPMDTENNRNNALSLDTELSEGDDTEGYTLLVYSVGMLYDSETWETPSDTERIIDLYSFMAGAERDTWEETIAVATHIDNTQPESAVVSVSPEIATMTDNPILVRTGITATFTVCDPETGLKALYLREFLKVITGNALIREPDPNDPDDEGYMPGPYDFEWGDPLKPDEETVVPFIDKDGNGIDYSETPFEKSYTDADGNVIVTLRVYGDEDIKGTKTLVFEFKDNAICFSVEPENMLGERGYVPAIPGGYPEGIGVYNIRKLPAIGEDDYTLSYEYVNGNGERVKFDPTSAESADIWYAEAYVTLVPTAIGENRGLAVTNNGGSFERKLETDDPAFTFELRDAFGDTASVDVSLSHFDIFPGTLSYTLAHTSKTAKPVGITVTATDAQSGVARVALYGKDGKEIPLTYDEADDVYTGEVPVSGTYRLWLLDKAGNKTEKSFTVSNINTVKPKATVSYSVDQSKKSRENVIATLTFDKANTRITAIDPDDSTKLSSITVNYGSSTLRFTENGTVTVYYADEYGNEGDPVLVTVKSIYRVAPSVAVKKLGVNAEKSEVTVGFDKALNAAGVPVDTERELWELTVMYGGIAKRIQTLDKNGKVVDEAAFTFRDNGTYTFKVYDNEGAYAYVTVEISEIDSKAPVIKSFSWSYDYDILENGTWQTKTEAGTIEIGVDTSGTESGYILSTAGKTEADKMPVTNGDVTVTVVTDEPTRTLGSNEEDYTTDAEKVFDDNGMYIFDREKNNRLTDSYAIDVELIDKTPPVLRLASDELVFYENADVGEPFNIELLTKPGTAFSAYDLFRGKTDLSDEVEVIIDPRLNTTDFAANTFDRSIAYTVTYRVSDRAHNVTEAVRTIRLVGMYDTVALVNGRLPDASGRAEVQGDTVSVTLANFAGVSYVRYAAGLKTMGEMKKSGTMLAQSETGTYDVSGLASGWYTVFIQTDKRDYITLQIYVNH